MFNSIYRLKSFFAIFALVMITACETAPLIGAGQTASTDSSMRSRDVGEYRLGPADEMRITVFGEANLSGEYIVDGEGTVSFPLIGEIVAKGRTVREFQREVERRLAEGYIREPSVSAEVLNFRPYYILGEVNRPGEYPFTNRLTVMNAIATAEGFTYRANKKIVILKGADETSEVRVDLTPTTRVMPGDTIRVLERLF